MISEYNDTSFLRVVYTFLTICGDAALEAIIN